MVKEEKVSAEEGVRDIRRQTRKKYNAEEKIRMVLEGLRGEESIAEALFITEKTVEKHLTSIFTKTGAGNRAGATAFAYQHQLTAPR